MRPDAIRPSAERRHVVRPADSARVWANELDVLATPILLWLGEVTAMEALAPALGPDEMSVGFGHDEARHLAPTPVGDVVRITAVHLGTEGRRVRFAIEAWDSEGLVFRGTHERGVVDRTEFTERAAKRAATLDR